ncbi:unnamed protein product, partial [Symbiodinium pilosum]
ECGSHCSAGWETETIPTPSTELGSMSDSEEPSEPSPSEGMRFSWPPPTAKPELDMELVTPLGDLRRLDDVVEPFSAPPSERETEASFVTEAVAAPEPKEILPELMDRHILPMPFPPTHSIDCEGELDVEDMSRSVGSTDDVTFQHKVAGPVVKLLPKMNAATSSSIREQDVRATGAEVASKRTSPSSVARAEACKPWAGVQSKTVAEDILLESFIDVKDAKQAGRTPSLEPSSSAGARENLEEDGTEDRVDKQDSFDPLAKMTQRECKRVAGRFLKANGFFHVDELESTWRHPLFEAVLQNRPRVVKALLLLGSRREVLSAAGLTPEHLAELLHLRKGGFEAVLRVFATDGKPAAEDFERLKRSGTL